MNEQTNPGQHLGQHRFGPALGSTMMAMAADEAATAERPSSQLPLEQPTVEQPTADLATALIALAGDESAITPNDPQVLDQLHKRFAARTRAEFRSQAADRLEALREWIDRSLRYHVVRLRYDPLEEEPMVSYSYAAQDLLEGASKLTDLVLDAHEEDVVLRTMVVRDVTETGKSLSSSETPSAVPLVPLPSGASLEYAAKHGFGPSVAEAASRYTTGYVPGEEVMV